MSGTKVCTKCGESKEFSEFDKDSSKADGHKWKCKKCRQVYQASLETDPNKLNARMKRALREARGTNITKVCSVCDVEKQLAEFHKDDKCKLGVSSKCKECKSIYSNKRQLKLPREKRLAAYARTAIWKKNNPEIALMFSREANKKQSLLREEDRFWKFQADDTPIGMKRCTKCNEVLQLTEFNKRQNRPVGTLSACKECCKHDRIKLLKSRKLSA